MRALFKRLPHYSTLLRPSLFPRKPMATSGTGQVARFRVRYPSIVRFCNVEARRNGSTASKTDVVLFAMLWMHKVLRSVTLCWDGLGKIKVGFLLLYPLQILHSLKSICPAASSFQHVQIISYQLILWYMSNLLYDPRFMLMFAGTLSSLVG